MTEFRLAGFDLRLVRVCGLIESHICLLSYSSSASVLVSIIRESARKFKLCGQTLTQTLDFIVTVMPSLHHNSISHLYLLTL